MRRSVLWCYLAMVAMALLPALVDAQTARPYRSLMVRALEGGWIEAEGEAQVSNITPEEARRRALQDAREQAILFAVGTDVRARSLLLQGETQEHINETFIALSEQVSAGRIVAERGVEWETFSLPAEPLPVTVYRARIQVKVAKERGHKDPDFKVRAMLNKTQFYPGEEMRLVVEVTKPCYLTVLNLTATDSVIVLLPNAYHPSHLVQPDAQLQIPDAEELAMGIRYRVSLPAGQQAATEVIKVVATREEYNFGQRMLRQATAANQVPTKRTALVELMRWLIQVPKDQRAEADVVYEIRRMD